MATDALLGMLAGRTTLSPTEFASAVSAITSSFGDPTRREIYLFAHASPEGVTAAEVAERFGLHPNVARHHLDKLSAGGHLDTESVRPASGVGRPSKRYRVQPTETEHDQPGGINIDLEVRRDDVLIRLLGRALSELGDARSQELAEEVGLEFGRAMAGSMGDHTRSVRAALHAVADALSAHGFAAHAERRDGQLQIVAEHCPFGDAVIEHPVICAVDRGMVKGMLHSLYGETAVDLAASRSRGDDVCITSVES